MPRRAPITVLALLAGVLGAVVTPVPAVAERPALTIRADGAVRLSNGGTSVPVAVTVGRASRVEIRVRSGARVAVRRRLGRLQPGRRHVRTVRVGRAQVSRSRVCSRGVRVEATASARGRRVVRRLTLRAARCAKPTVTPLSGASASGATRPAGADRVGVSSKLVWTNEAEATREMGRLRAGGVGWVREDLPWRSLEPARGAYDWKRGDALMAAAARTGMHVAGILSYSPPWASSDPSGAGEKAYPPKDPADYARFAGAVAARYGAGGSFWRERPELPATPVKALELWNEPNIHHSWRPEPDPAGYATLAAGAARAIRAAAPDVTILMPGDVHQHRADYAVRPWLADVLRSDPALGGLVDAYSSHPYPGTKSDGPFEAGSDPRWSFGRVPQIATVASAAGAGHPIWITEIGWNTAPGTGSVSEQQQADFVVGAVRRALGQWDGVVARTFVYSWGTDGWGLRRADGTARPAWDALSAFMQGLPAS